MNGRFILRINGLLPPFGGELYVALNNFPRGRGGGNGKSFCKGEGSVRGSLGGAMLELIA